MPTATTRRPRRRGSDPEVHDRALYDALDRLVRAYQFRDRQRVCYRGLSVTECYALQAVIRDQGPTQKELSRVLRLDKSTTSRVVDSLEQRGILVRTTDPEDARAYRLAASSKGRKLHAQIEADVVRRQRRVLEDLPATVRRAAVLVLTRLADDAVTRFQRAP